MTTLDPAAIRLERGYSIAEVARRMGCAPSTVRGWETRRRPPGADDLARLVEQYDLGAAEAGRMLMWWR